MNNPFKTILHHYEVPKMLKHKVLSDVNMIKLTLDIADLFMVKYPKTIGDVFSNNNHNNKERN